MVCSGFENSSIILLLRINNRLGTKIFFTLSKVQMIYCSAIEESKHPLILWCLAHNYNLLTFVSIAISPRFEPEQRLCPDSITQRPEHCWPDCPATEMSAPRGRPRRPGWLGLQTPGKTQALCSEHHRAHHHVQNHEDGFLIERNTYITCKGTWH